MKKSLYQSWSFAAGFLAASAISVAAVSLPGLQAKIGEMIGDVKTWNYDQLMYYEGDTMLKYYDRNSNGLVDFSEGAQLEGGSVVKLMFTDQNKNGHADFFDMNYRDFPESDSTMTDALTLTYASTAEVCLDGEDNDRDGSIDCNDTQCSGHSACAVALPGGEIRGAKGLPDDKMPSSAEMIMPGFSQEICGDDVDNDGDSMYDTWDPDCSGAIEMSGSEFENEVSDPFPPSALPGYPAAPGMGKPFPVPPVQSDPAGGQQGQGGSRPSTPDTWERFDGPYDVPQSPFSTINIYDYEDCPNPFAVNADGKINISNPDCWKQEPVNTAPPIYDFATSSLHGAGGNEMCTNSTDDDDDMLIDYSDPDCGNSVACRNGHDDDDDGYIDSLDPGCRISNMAKEEN